MAAMDPQVSFIVPVFNAESWLADCLDSICAQTLPDIELICVNDASTDGSLAILADYARRDPRVTVVDLSRNCGVGRARNAGFALAKGKYAGFVDCDDTIDATFCASLFHAAEESGADMVSAPMRIVADRDKMHEMPQWEWFCSSLFRTDFLRKNAVRFPARYAIGEDTVFMARALIARPRRSKVDAPWYNYRQMAASASHRPTDEKCRSCVGAYRQVFSEIAEAARAGAVAPALAGSLFADFLQHFVRFIMHKSTEPVKREAAEMLAGLYGGYPHRAEADAALRLSEPELLALLTGGSAPRLAEYFRGGKKRFAADLRARLKKAPRP